MAPEDRSALRNEAEFEHALSEVERMLDIPPSPETPEDRYFGQLLNKLAEYHATKGARGENLERLQDLDKQLAAFGKRWPRPDLSHHWSPLLGGDLAPDQHHGD